MYLFHVFGYQGLNVFDLNPIFRIYLRDHLIKHIQILLLGPFGLSLLSKEIPKVMWIFSPKMAKNRSRDGIINRPGSWFIHVFG